jgi:hypothetical protein
MPSSAPQSSPGFLRLPACAALFLLLYAAPGDAQERFRVSGEASFRKAPDGVVLGALPRGTELTARRTNGSWVEFRLEGWIFTSSTTRTNRDGFDLSVKARENLRSEPNGAMIARVSAGALLNRKEERGAWTRVQRDVWISRTVLQNPNRAVATTPPRPAARDTTRNQPTAGVGAGMTAAAPGEMVQTAGVTILQSTPSGAEIGRLQPGARARVVSRSGGWVRVQVDAWVKEDDTRPSVDSSALRGISAAEVRAAPGRYVGKVVEWRVQFLAVQKADELRPEIPEGRYYLLTRGPLPESGFVYVIIPQDQVDRFRAMTPLEELAVRGTIKAASTRYLPNPVLELITAGAPTP